MLDINRIRKDLAVVAASLARRGFKLDTDLFQQLETERKALQVQLETLQNERNLKSKEIGKVKSQGGDIQALMNVVNKINEELKVTETAFENLQKRFTEFLSLIPNTPQEFVPVGKSDQDNLEVKCWGEPNHFSFKPKDHVDLGLSSKSLDFETGAKLSGTRFVVMRGAIARMHRA